MQRDKCSHGYPTRRDVLVLGAGVFGIAATSLWSVRRRRTLVRRRVPVMGTLAEIAVVHGDEHYAHGAIDAAVAELRWVERVMTRFTATSDVGRANLQAWREPVAITAATRTVLREALGWAEASGGAFDPCLGSAMALWDIGNRRVPPSTERIRGLAGRKLYRSLEISTWRRAPVVRFAERDVAIDLGGIAKGYGVDAAVSTLREWGITQALVNVGGDLYAIGRSADGDSWTVGIRSPEDPSRLAGSLQIENQAVATSGDYLQYFTHRGTRYHHLLDPVTGAPRDTVVHSVTIVADRCLTADAAATAAFGLPRAEAERLLRQRPTNARIV